MPTTSQKNKLQEWIQRNATTLPLPLYNTSKTSNGLFQCKVTVCGEQFQGKEQTKKIKAEQSAARAALRFIEQRQQQLKADIVDEEQLLYDPPEKFNSVVFVDLDSFEQQQIDQFPELCRRLKSLMHLIGFTSDESTKRLLSTVMEIQHTGACQVNLAFQLGRWCNALEILSTSLRFAASKQYFVFHILSSDVYTFQPVLESLQHQGCIAFHICNPVELLAFRK